MRNNETGRSMVEMLGVLAIIGVLSAGGLAGYSKAMFKHKLNNTMEQITMLVTNIRTAYGQQRNYSGLNNEKALGLGIIPPVMGKTKSTLTNPFKGAVTIVAAAAKSGVDNTGFTVKYEKLPKEACISLATADFGSGAGSGFVGVEVNGDASSLVIGGRAAAAAVGTAGQDGYKPAVTAVAEGAAYTMAAAITACKDSEQNFITWKFY